MKRLTGLGAAAAVLISCSVPATAEGLEPYQMMRSLQLMQDQIAGGDHAALPMQRKLLAIIDERLRSSEIEDFEDRRNINAVFIYGTSGGNPETLERLVSRLELDEKQKKLGDGILRYARGDLAGARMLLADLEIEQMDRELAAPLALVVGSLLAQQDPPRALELYDAARLLSPGTLIEEAALRRSIPVIVELQDEERLGRAARQYVDRFLHSPYASQFAEAFVSAIIVMHEKISTQTIEEVMAGMTPDHGRVIYLRIARQSAIEGYDRLLSFASQKVKEYRIVADEIDPRAVLYANIASITSQNVNEVLRTLNGIEDRRLAKNDRELLRAARTVAKSIVSPPDRGTSDSAAQPNLQQSAETAARQPESEEDGATFVAGVREKLKSIDSLLQEEEL